jgi:hypothetical protein
MKAGVRGRVRGRRGRGRVLVGGQNGNGGSEAIAAFGDRFDEGLGFLVVEGLTEHEDALGEAAMFDEGVFPDRGKELILRDDFARALEEKGEDLGGLGSERDHALSLIEGERAGVEAIGTEGQQHLSEGRGEWARFQ